MDRLAYPDWQHVYHEAVFELDPQRLNGRVAAARQAISARLAALPQHESPGIHRERKALQDALTVLDIVVEIEGSKTIPRVPNPAARPLEPAA